MAALLLMAGIAFGQVVNSLPSSFGGDWDGTYPSGWSQFGVVSQTANPDGIGVNCAALNATGEYIAIDFSCNIVTSVSFYGLKTNTFAGSIEIQTSSNNTNWTTVQVLSLTTTATLYTQAISGGSRYIRFYMTSRTNGRVELDGITFTGTSCSSAPTNDLCSGATNLPCGTTNLAGTTVNSVSETPPASASTSNYGVWYSFVGDGQSTTISSTSTSAFDHEMVVLTGSACGSYSILSSQDGPSDYGTETYTFTTVNSQQYYVWIAYFTTGSTTGTFTISRSCVAAPTPPANDHCSNATNLPCGTTNLAGTTANSASETPPASASTSNYGVWYSFIGDGQSTTISSTSTSAFDHEMVILTGSACGSYSILSSQDGPSDYGTETYTFITVVGQQYYVWIAYYTTGSTTGTFTISRSCVAAPTPPANDLCSNASNLPCGTTNLAGTTSNSASETPPASASTSNYGVWYSFVGDGQITTISSTSTSAFDHEMVILTGTSCASYAIVTSQDDPSDYGTETYTFTTVVGQQYYVWIAYFTTGSTTGTFTISRSCTLAPTPPANDQCSNATPLPCGTYNLAGTTVGAAFESVSGCSNVNNYGVWYMFSGSGAPTTLSILGNSFDVGFRLYSGTCSSLSSMVCIDDYGSSGTESYSFNAASGQTYFLYVSHYDNTASTTGTFVVSRTCQPSCSTNDPAGNTCALAEPICDLNGYCGNTSSSYTVNTWTELSDQFYLNGNGASIENNSFLSFVAGASTVTLEVYVSNCYWGDGIQMMIFGAATCGSGPVTTYAVWNPEIETDGIITATGLTPGNIYYLMIDGYSGDDCDYVIGATALSGVNIPVTASSDVSICAGASTTLTVSGGNGNYNWSPSSTLNSSSGSSVVATPTQTTTYTITSTTGNPLCPQTTENQVTVTVSNPSAVISSFNPLCENSTTILTTNPAGQSYLWSPGGQNTQSISVNSAGTYSVTVTDSNNCSAQSNAVNVSVVTNPSVIFLSPP
ncbi:MAG: discoidin domain-containing protein [Flavobacteriales bacterium]|nr:discoidin domain-containing protein [Flavobacteriales bacterium]